MHDNRQSLHRAFALCYLRNSDVFSDLLLAGFGRDRPRRPLARA